MVTLVSYFTFTMIEGDDKSVFMPGELTGGHHQIGIACNACHGESFSDADEIQEKCESCHADQRKKPFDSHPRSKFTDPRNADRLENINALYCVTCHQEHKPDISSKEGVTQPMDFCVHCHKDIAEDRPSHEGMAFDTCASAGCHNYHNNQSLYTDFLVKHMHEPNLLENPVVAMKEFASVLEEVTTYPHDRYPVRQLTIQDIDAPPAVLIKTNNKIKQDWSKTAHAHIGANCTSCHMTPAEGSDEPVWNNKPDEKACAQCHDIEVKNFKQGKHGMRLALDLSPMTPDQARLPMTEKSAHLELGCNSCHTAHDYDLQPASVDACLGCHKDDHSLAYKESGHYQLWLREQSGELPEGSGVSCATCHMPRVPMDVSDWLRRVVVQHNQNATLVPNEKMIRTTCMSCHGLGYSIDSLADEKLIKNNFATPPSIHIESIDMAEKDNLRHQQELESESQQP